MRRSFFVRTVLIIIALCVLLSGAMLFLVYRRVYNNTAADVRKNLYLAADMTKETLMTLDDGDFSFDERSKYILDNICQEYETSYIYVVKLDSEGTGMEYVALGEGKDSDSRFRVEREPGDIVKFGKRDEAMIRVYRKEKFYDYERYTDAFGEVVACYMYMDQEFDRQTGEYKTASEPLLIGVEVSLTSMMDDFVRQFMVFAAFLSFLAIVITLAICIVLWRKVSKPIKRISSRMDSFITDMEGDFEPLQVKGHDEFSVMSSSFNSMGEQIKTYVSHIEEMTREKHTQQAELDVAKRIQMGLLRPEKYEDEHASVSTFMRAAKNVGGDLYEYDVLDDGRVYIMIGDVSGKGITASIFMATAVALLRQYALLGYSPAKLLDMFNTNISDFNPEEMFITTFVAVYNPADRSLTYANAGHNPPYVISEELKILDAECGFVAGVFDDEEYDEETIYLKDGDVVFLFTDGVNEATHEKHLYGNKRLEDVLRSMAGKGDKEILDGVLESVEDFVAGEEQSDDITMLALKVR